MGVMSPMSTTPWRSSMRECSDDNNAPDQLGRMRKVPPERSSTKRIQR
jgi:hypothetical protein